MALSQSALRRANFKAAFHRYEPHIFPISSWENESVEHWVLLVLDAKTKNVKNYEILEKMRETNYEAAERIHEIAGFEWKVERVNKVRQVGVACGEGVCNYAEYELREATGEGWG